MMVLFQNMIIYMPGLPPNARRETVEAYKNQCSGIQWREESTQAKDGTQISLCVASVSNGISTHPRKTIYIVYFQGNASSIPPRLPLLSPVLRRLQDRAVVENMGVTYTMICCSYRGYWTSRGRPSERGLEMDAAATLQWIKKHDNEASGEEIPVVLWGQSIGAGVATSLAARADLFSKLGLSLTVLILETPFLNIRAMLETLYPQKWLPYRHLWPFLRNHLDSWRALGMMAESFHSAGVEPPKVLILEAERDELVPKEHGRRLEKRCLELGLVVSKKIVRSALHTEIMGRSGGINAVVQAIEDVSAASGPRKIS